MLQELIISKPKDGDNYFFSGIITWRGISFYVSTAIKQSNFGSEHQIVIVHNNAIFEFRKTKWKQWWDTFGTIPAIFSGDFHLQIETGLDRISFKEKYLDKPCNDYSILCSGLMLSATRGNYETNIPKPQKSVVLEVGPKETTLEKELYKYHDDKVDIESMAYFDSNRLVVDYWKLYDNYESEEFIYVSEEGTKKLKNHFYVSEKSELLFKIKETCSGKESFELFEKLLNKLEILFTRVRR